MVIMEELRFDNGIKRIAIKDEDDEVIAVLRINVADAEVIEKFAKVIDSLNNISDRCDAEAKKRQAEVEEVEETDDVMAQIPKAVEINQIRVKYIKEIMDTLDSLFGKETMHSIYGDTVPDELALVDFVEGIVPIMNKLFGKRLEISRKRYNTKRKGAR
nr:MAG TPA: tail assembly chaperone protein [Caudoviricetes sp.]